MNWFTSDEHFNHFNICEKFVFRKFRTVEEMNRELIKRHNSRVKPNDTVFHLGDFKLTNNGTNKHEIVRQLNGHHVFILGNHDKNNGCNTPIKYMVIETYGQSVLLIHKPEDSIELMPILKINTAFVGHVHEKWKYQEHILNYEKRLLINVGVDQWDYYPIDAKQIFKDVKREVGNGHLR